jgi:hypothetical protein
MTKQEWKSRCAEMAQLVIAARANGLSDASVQRAQDVLDELGYGYVNVASFKAGDGTVMASVPLDVLHALGDMQQAVPELDWRMAAAADALDRLRTSLSEIAKRLQSPAMASAPAQRSASFRYPEPTTEAKE